MRVRGFNGLSRKSMVLRRDAKHLSITHNVIAIQGECCQTAFRNHINNIS